MSIFDEKRILIIAPEHKMIFKDYKDFGYNMLPTFKSENLILRLARELIIRCHLPFQRVFFKKIPSDFDYYIVYDSLVTSDYIKYISAIIPCNKIIFFFDNIVADREWLVKMLKEKNINAVTLEKNDSTKYGLILIDDFFNSEYVKRNDNSEFDVVFFGKDKGRLNQLLELKQEFDLRGLNTVFHITKTYRTSKNNSIYKKAIPYRELLSFVAKSKSILEVLQDGQEGLTLRAMEALFFEKKLITTSKSIKNYRFYHRNNIFILGEDDFSNITSFINSPFKRIPTEIVSYYDFSNAWTRVIKSIEKNES